MDLRHLRCFTPLPGTELQLGHALEMLAHAASVTGVSDHFGYASPSNFISMFRRAFGDFPAHYFLTKTGSTGCHVASVLAIAERLYGSLFDNEDRRSRRTS